MTEEILPIWTYIHCPECKEPIKTPKQIRCSNCKVLFDWDEEE